MEQRGDFEAFPQDTEAVAQTTSPPVAENTHGAELLRAALAAGDRSRVESLLATRFAEVAQGDFSWLLDLEATEFDVQQMAKMLLNSSGLSPAVGWSDDLVPQAGVLDEKPPELDCKFHQEACAHHTPAREKALEFDSMTVDSNRFIMRQRVAALCGLGGVTPQNGQNTSGLGLTFSQSTAYVVYDAEDEIPTGGHGPHSEPHGSQDGTAINRVRHLKEVMAKIKAAASTIQHAGFCCDEFTILTETSNPNIQGGNPFVSFKTVQFKHFELLDSAIELCLEGGGQPTPEPGLRVEHATLQIKDVMKTLSAEEVLPLIKSLSVSERLHVCSLAVQILGLGLLLYSQAHTGVLQLFFLTGPLSRVSLQGSF
jgi:hypothetical protein